MRIGVSKRYRIFTSSKEGRRTPYENVTPDVDSTDKPINDFVSVPKLANQHFLYSGFARYHDDNGVAVSFEEIRLTKLNGKNYSEDSRVHRRNGPQMRDQSLSTLR